MRQDYPQSPPYHLMTRLLPEGDHLPRPLSDLLGISGRLQPSANPIVRFVEEGLLKSDGKTVRLTAQGRLLSNDVFQQFLGLDSAQEADWNSNQLSGPRSADRESTFAAR